MGNCHCRPREGGESLRDFLARKFHKIAGKRKIDDLVTIAIQDEGENSGIQRGADETGKAGDVKDHPVDMELLDLDYETDSEDEVFPDSDGRTTLNHKPLEKYRKVDDLEKKTKEDYHEEKPSRQEVFEHKEGNDYIRVLQQQLQLVQSELANLRRGASNRGHVTADINHSESDSARSFQSQESDGIETMPGEPMYETDSSTETDSYRNPRSIFLHGQGDTRGSLGGPHRGKRTDDVLPAGAKELAYTRMVQTRGDNKFDTRGTDDKMPQTDCRRSKTQGMIMEGLRTKPDARLPGNRVQTTRNATAQNNRTTGKDSTVGDKARIAAKIALLQKRDPKLPGPDKGIVWPKTMENLSKADKAYYVEQFLKSELFRQRCLRKYQGSKTWMNGLSPFHIWVLENEDTAEIEAVLHPLPKRQNNAQAKVRCWRGNTPPPPPKSQ